VSASPRQEQSVLDRIDSMTAEMTEFLLPWLHGAPDARGGRIAAKSSD